ncbi:hypothetical protein E1301_Tti019283 [Triplophysa tibetana]|uniref:TTF-type domain-containing protein n=1 Tax=Triplophysa tibetana TaxID=1572043 RepID=A0A5A9PBQ1_9TELE|nr:hypothetical protein E1301_Tti019283 [Triplophysa tibetana]
MKRKGEITDFFLKRQKQADKVQTDSNPCMTTGPQSSSPPETSQSQCGQASQEPPTGLIIKQTVSHSVTCPVQTLASDELRDDTESSDSEQESEPELPGYVKEPQPTTSSRKYAVPKGPNDISRSRDEGPVQPGLKTFPRTQYGTRKRAFNSSWYKDNSWLEYSVSQDSTYCFACRHFSLPKTSESALTSQAGFCNWTKALFKDSGFKLHSKADHHFNAMYAWNEYKRSVDGNSSMLDVMDKERKKKVEENCAYIKKHCRRATFNCHPKYSTERSSGV